MRSSVDFSAAERQAGDLLLGLHHGALVLLVEGGEADAGVLQLGGGLQEEVLLTQLLHPRAFLGQLLLELPVAGGGLLKGGLAVPREVRQLLLGGLLGGAGGQDLLSEQFLVGQGRVGLLLQRGQHGLEVLQLLVLGDQGGLEFGAPGHLFGLFRDQGVPLALSDSTREVIPLTWSAFIWEEATAVFRRAWRSDWAWRRAAVSAEALTASASFASVSVSFLAVPRRGRAARASR